MGAKKLEKYTVEFNEMVCEWLVHISKLTGNSIEKVIEASVYNQITGFKDELFKCFTHLEKRSKSVLFFD